MHLHLSHARLQIPGHVGIVVGDELDGHQAIRILFVPRGNLRLGDLSGLAVEARDVAEHVIQRHQQVAETEHGNGDHGHFQRSRSSARVPRGNDKGP